MVVDKDGEVAAAKEEREKKKLYSSFRKFHALLLLEGTKFGCRRFRCQFQANIMARKVKARGKKPIE